MASFLVSFRSGGINFRTSAKRNFLFRSKDGRRMLGEICDKLLRHGNLVLLEMRKANIFRYGITTFSRHFEVGFIDVICMGFPVGFCELD